MKGSRESHPPKLTPRNGLPAYEPHGLFRGGTLSFARLESSHVEFNPTRGRSPTFSSVYVQLKSVRSDHDVGSNQVPLAVEGMSPDLVQATAAVVPGFLVVPGVDPEDPPEDEPPVDDDADAFEPILMTFLYMRTPTVSPPAARTARIAIVQSTASR